MQSVEIKTITNSTVKKYPQGGIKVTANINGSKQAIEAWVSKKLQAECKTQDKLIQRLKKIDNIYLGASVEVNENGNSVVKYWITAPDSGTVIASW